MLYFASQSSFELSRENQIKLITGYSVLNPIECDNFDWLINQRVTIVLDLGKGQGKHIPGIVKGVESFTLNSHSVGEPIALLI